VPPAFPSHARRLWLYCGLGLISLRSVLSWRAEPSGGRAAVIRGFFCFRVFFHCSFPSPVVLSRATRSSRAFRLGLPPLYVAGSFSFWWDFSLCRSDPDSGAREPRATLLGSRFFALFCPPFLFPSTRYRLVLTRSLYPPFSPSLGPFRVPPSPSFRARLQA